MWTEVLCIIAALFSGVGAQGLPCTPPTEQSSFLVYWAGAPEVNGVYEPYGLFDGVMSYMKTNDSGTDYHMYRYLFVADGVRNWFISAAGDEQFGNLDYYNNPSSGAFPPHMEWSPPNNGKGKEPSPLVECYHGQVVPPAPTLPPPDYVLTPGKEIISKAGRQELAYFAINVTDQHEPLTITVHPVGATDPDLYVSLDPTLTEPTAHNYTLRSTYIGRDTIEIQPDDYAPMQATGAQGLVYVGVSVFNNDNEDVLQQFSIVASFGYQEVDPTQSTCSIDGRQSVPVDATIKVLVSAKDSNGRASGVADQRVHAVIEHGQAEFHGLSDGMTDASGNIRFELTDTVAEVATFQAFFTNLNSEALVNLRCDLRFLDAHRIQGDVIAPNMLGNILLINGVNDQYQNQHLTVTDFDEEFQFSPLVVGTAYNVTVKSSAAGWACRVENGAGVIEDATATIRVVCEPSDLRYAVRVAVTGVDSPPSPLKVHLLDVSQGTELWSHEYQSSGSFGERVLQGTHYLFEVVRDIPGMECVVSGITDDILDADVIISVNCNPLPVDESIPCSIHGVGSTLALFGESYVSLPENPDSVDWLPSERFTLETWVYVMDATQSSVIFDGDSAEATGTQERLGWNLKLNEGVPAVFLSLNTYNVQLQAKDYKLAADTWTHLAVVKGSTTLQLYADGDVVASADVPDTPVLYSGTFDDTHVQVGCYSRSGYGGLDVPREQFFQGHLSEMRLWDVARSEKQINFFRKHHINNGHLPGLYAYWPFDEDYGDYASHSYPATSSLSAALVSCELPDGTRPPVTPLPTKTLPPVGDFLWRAPTSGDYVTQMESFIISWTSDLDSVRIVLKNHDDPKRVVTLYEGQNKGFFTWEVEPRDVPVSVTGGRGYYLLMYNGVGGALVSTSAPFPVYYPDQVPDTSIPDVSSVCKAQVLEAVEHPDFVGPARVFQTLTRECVLDKSTTDADCTEGIEDFTRACEGLGENYSVCSLEISFDMVFSDNVGTPATRRVHFCRPAACSNESDMDIYEKWMNDEDPQCRAVPFITNCVYSGAACPALDLPTDAELLTQLQRKWEGVLHHSDAESGECKLESTNIVFRFDGNAITIEQRHLDAIEIVYDGVVKQLKAQPQGYNHLQFSDKDGSTSVGEFCTTYRVDFPSALRGEPRLVLNWDIGGLDEPGFGLQCPNFPQHLNYYVRDQPFCGLGGKGRSSFVSPLLSDSTPAPTSTSKGGPHAAVIALVVIVGLLSMGLMYMCYRYQRKQDIASYMTQSDHMVADHGGYDAPQAGHTQL